MYNVLIYNKKSRWDLGLFVVSLRKITVQY